MTSKEKKKMHNKKYRENNKEKIKAYNKQYRENNTRENVGINKEKQREYNQKHKASKNLWSKNNPQAKRKARLKGKYGIEPEEYDNMLIQQNGVCAICLDEEVVILPNGKRRPLSVDHDHKTGDIRGLLCGSCNMGLGLFEDDIASMHRAIKYIEKHLDKPD